MSRNKMQNLLTNSILSFLLTACSLFEPETGITENFTFLSSSLRSLSTVLVYYPESYSSSTPVIYLLNGWGAEVSAWGSGVDLAQEALDRDIMFVSLSAGVNTYTNDPLHDDENYEDYVLEVVSKVEDEYDIDIDYQSRALCGISNGGGGALFILSEHPDSFIACGSLSGSVYSGMSNYSNFIDRGVRIDIGTTDGLLNQCRWLDNKLTEEDIDHEYYEHPGEHDWTFWKTYAPEQFDFLEGKISGY